MVLSNISNCFVIYHGQMLHGSTIRICFSLVLFNAVSLHCKLKLNSTTSRISLLSSEAKVKV